MRFMKLYGLLVGIQFTSWVYRVYHSYFYYNSEIYSVYFKFFCFYSLLYFKLYWRKIVHKIFYLIVILSTWIDFMNKTPCRNVNMVYFFFWLINKVYEKTMKVGLLIIIYIILYYILYYIYILYRYIYYIYSYNICNM